jgi:hypothetical protein
MDLPGVRRRELPQPARRDYRDRLDPDRHRPQLLARDLAGFLQVACPLTPRAANSGIV